MASSPRGSERCAWLYIAAVSLFTTCMFWRQANWMVYGGIHDFLELGMLVLPWLGAFAATACALASTRPPTIVAWAIVASLAPVILPLIDELIWEQRWLVLYPSRGFMYGIAVSALALSVVLARNATQHA